MASSCTVYPFLWYLPFINGPSLSREGVTYPEIFFAFILTLLRCAAIFFLDCSRFPISFLDSALLRSKIIFPPLYVAIWPVGVTVNSFTVGKSVFSSAGLPGILKCSWKNAYIANLIFGVIECL